MVQFLGWVANAGGLLAKQDSCNFQPAIHLISNQICSRARQ